MADESKDFFKLDKELLSRLVFDTFGDQRYTQDSPIMPDVWMAFVGAPRAKVDLLLTPVAGHSASQLATLLSERLAKFDSQEEDEIRLRHMDYAAMFNELTARSAAPGGRVDKRAEFDVAYSRSNVVAEVDFLQLVCVIVSMTDWWDKLHPIVRNYRELKNKLRNLNGGKRTLARIITESEIVANRSTWDFIRFCALAGFIATVRKAEEDAERDKIEPDSDAYTARQQKLEKLMAALTKGDTPIEDVQEIIDAYEDVAEQVLDYTESLPDEQRKPRIFMITENRVATLSLSESRGTIKADAANNLFKIDTSDFAWAVIDGGIDARHPAFLDVGAVEKYLAELRAKAPPKTPQEDMALRQKIDSIWREDIPLDGPFGLSKFSRVRETYDFTYLRRLLSLKDLPTPEQGGPPVEIANYIRSTYHRQLQSLSVRTLLAREIDWDMVAPLIRVPHGPNYTKPSVGHGTHVSGILGGHWLANHNPESVDLIGICPQIRLYDLRVYNPAAGSDEFTVQYALQFVEYLNRNRDLPLVHGVNLSLSMMHKVMSFACGRTPVCDECNDLVSTGVVVVVAAGNDGYKTFKTDKGDYAGYHAASITDPGNAEDVITVGSTHRSHPHNYGVSYFSSRGPTGDGRRKPDLVAPGEKITAPVLNCRVQRMDGTSMAAPHVSGAAALLMARHRELIGNPRRIKEILCRTATDLGRESHFQGAGMVDILRALQSV